MTILDKYPSIAQRTATRNTERQGKILYFNIALYIGVYIIYYSTIVICIYDYII